MEAKQILARAKEKGKVRLSKIGILHYSASFCNNTVAYDKIFIHFYKKTYLYDLRLQYVLGHLHSKGKLNEVAKKYGLSEAMSSTGEYRLWEEMPKGSLSEVCLDEQIWRGLEICVKQNYRAGLLEDLVQVVLDTAAKTI